MITNEQREKLLSNLTEKGLNKRTQNYILKYANKNSEIFSNSIDMDKLIDRLSTHIDKNISYNIGLSKLPFLNGEYNFGKGAIRINPRLLLNKKKRESTILHEIDHAATASYVENPRDYTFKMINEGLKFPFIIEKFLNKILPISFFDKLRDKMVDYYIKNNKVRTSGIHNPKNRALNEGITRYKQLKYMGEELKGDYNTIIRDSYGPEYRVASEISKIIGEDNLIRMSFNNDFEGMCKLFFEKTDGKGNLEEISSKLEETHSRKRFLHPIKFIKNYSNINRQFKEYHKIIKENSKNKKNEEPDLGDQLKEMLITDINIEKYKNVDIDKKKTLDIRKQQDLSESAR